MKKKSALPPSPKSASAKVSHKRVFTLARWQPGSANTGFFAAFEPFHSCEFRASIARTPFCAILWRSPTKTQNTPPPPKTRNFMDMGFSCRKNAFFQASIKLTPPFPAPELRTKILRTRGFFWLIPWIENPVLLFLGVFVSLVCLLLWMFLGFFWVFWMLLGFFLLECFLLILQGFQGFALFLHGISRVRLIFTWDFKGSPYFYMGFQGFARSGKSLMFSRVFLGFSKRAGKRRTGKSTNASLLCPKCLKLKCKFSSLNFVKEFRRFLG